MIKKFFRYFLLFLLAVPALYGADVKIDRIYSSYMVIQQQRPVNFSGTADPGKVVTVEFAGKKVSAETGSDGKWQVTFPAMKASFTPRQVVITGGSKPIILKEVLVGEVWFCSGQSNMALMIGRKYVRGQSVYDCENVVKNAVHPHLRYAFQRYNPALEPQEVSYQWSSRWIQCKPEKAFFFSATAYFFARELIKELKVPVGVIVAAAGATRIQSWIPDDSFSGIEPEAGNIIKIKNSAKPETARMPGALFNGMVHPWTKLPVRGVLWYQGEANSGKDQLRYYPLHKRLIESWRKKWNDPQMPFLIVQLAGHDRGNSANWQKVDPNKFNGFALIRDIQQRMLEVPGVGLVTAIDIGDCDNVHPGNKLDVGIRLSLEARRMVYGEKIVSRGPLFKSAKPEKGRIRVTFDNAAGLKTSDGKAPNGFAVAGKDRKFYWAKAVIDGETVIVSAPQVKNPKYVRYAYVGYRGDLNLRNGANLPAFPFTSLPNKLSR